MPYGRPTSFNTFYQRPAYSQGYQASYSAYGKKKNFYKTYSKKPAYRRKYGGYRRTAATARATRPTGFVESIG